MTTLEDSRLIEVPFLLQEAVKKKRAILFLGAGASKECKNKEGDTPPNGIQLRDLLAQRFFGKPMINRSLMAVAEMAIQAAAGGPLVYDAVNVAFEGFEISDAHKLIPQFSWRMIATTNYDCFVESAYAGTKDRVQSLVPFVKDDEPVEERMQQVTNPLEYLKLHGCLRHRQDTSIPLVLSYEQYQKYETNRAHLFSRLRNLARECPIIFVGYSMDDPHIRDLIYRLGSDRRPRWYIVSPNAEPEDVSYWATQNVDVLPTTFGTFMKSLESSIPKNIRVLSGFQSTTDFPLRRFYVTQTEESSSLRSSVGTDLALVGSEMSYDNQFAKEFYSGYDTGWGALFKRFDVRRQVGDQLLFKMLLENEAPTEPVFLLLRGPGGSGKSIALKRAALDAASVYNALVLWLEPNGALRPEVFFEIFDLCQVPIFLFVDEVALHADKVNRLLHAAKAKAVPIVLIGAERESDWNTYCSFLEDQHPPQFLRVGNLSKGEVDNLLDLLEKHSCLGLLSTKSRQEQIDAFMKAESADRQLLVALHELTLGRPFEDIVLDEYEKVSPENARRLYLDIATMHQFSVTIRAGTISRISSIEFSDYKEKFLAPLKDLVKTATDPYTQDYCYKTRHPRVAALVFRQACPDDERKILQFLRLIEWLDVGYSSDHRALEGICRGRSLAENFTSVEGPRAIYEKAANIAPTQAYLHQQRAIFESNHPNGSIHLAESHAATARGIEPRNRVFIHTQAEIARKRACMETSPILKEQLRRQARKFLSQMPGNDPFSTSTLCKLHVDEIADLSDALSDASKAHEDQLFAEKLTETETALARAQQQFPDEADIFETEARLWKELNEKGKALSALKRAWKAVPRGTGTAIRISKIYDSQGRPDDARQILDDALARHPDDKAAHQAMALHLLSKKDYDAGVVERHLKKGFTLDDRNFEARFQLAQFLFLTNSISGATKIFSEIDEKAPAEFRRREPKSDNEITAKLPSYSGAVTAVKDGYFFIRSGCWPKSIFAHSTSLRGSEIGDLEIGEEVSFRIRFNRNGPTAVEVKVRET